MHDELWAFRWKFWAGMVIATWVILTVASCGGGIEDAEAKKPRPPPPPPPDGIVWTNLGPVPGVEGNYTPVVQLGGAQIRVYNNTANGVDGDMWLRVGSWASVGSPSKVLDITVPRDTFIRTLGVAQGASSAYYAVMYTGDGYPTQGGYSPSWATSPDGLAWTWQGPIGIFGRNQSSANNLIVDESRTDAYGCMAWLDLAGGLVLMHAPLPCDPAQWSSDGLNMWPIAGEQPQFVTAARTPYGYHLIGADRFDGTTNRSMRHVFSCTGLPPWRVLEMASDAGANGAKGTNLVFDSANNVIHALTSGTHYVLQGKPYPC